MWPFRCLDLLLICVFWWFGTLKYKQQYLQIIFAIKIWISSRILHWSIDPVEPTDTVALFNLKSGIWKCKCLMISPLSNISIGTSIKMGEKLKEILIFNAVSQASKAISWCDVNVQILLCEQNFLLIFSLSWYVSFHIWPLAVPIVAHGKLFHKFTHVGMLFIVYLCLQCVVLCSWLTFFPVLKYLKIFILHAPAPSDFLCNTQYVCVSVVFNIFSLVCLWNDRIFVLQNMIFGISLTQAGFPNPKYQVCVSAIGNIRYVSLPQKISGMWVCQRKYQVCESAKGKWSFLFLVLLPGLCLSPLWWGRNP